MKFAKEFTSQMVPEWQEAYMDYGSLKKVLKEIMYSRDHTNMLHSRPQFGPAPTMKVEASLQASFKRKVSLYRAFSGLTNRNHRGSPRKSDEEVILVNEEQPEGSEVLHYRTQFLASPDNEGDKERAFFQKLDNEFNKIIKFYKDKVLEVLMEAEDLNRQMDAFIALRIKVEKPMVPTERFEMSNFGSPDTVPAQSHPVHGRSGLDAIDETESEDANWRRSNVDQNRSGQILGPKPAALEVLNHVTINVAAQNKSGLKKFLLGLGPQLTYSRAELRKVEDLMKQAFIEFHQKLRLLKSYCFLNQLAFAKILKKYDKITSRNASKVYLEMVDNSYLGTCDEVTRLIERVEATFIKHFTNGNRQKGMNTLRPVSVREKHRVTFSLGFLSGCSIALLIALIILIHARQILKSEGRGRYMENIFPLYSLYGFIVLHMLMFSADMFFWRHFRVNYPFIFGFKQGTNLGYRDVFLLSVTLAVLALGAVLSNLDMEMDPATKKFSTLTELVPLGLILVVLLITCCPFNILYRSSRYYFIKCAFRCFCAPFYTVALQDFFLADQLTSQVQAFRSIEFYVCYYGWGDFKTRSHRCNENGVYNALYFIIPMIPYWSRFVQCLRRLFEEKAGINGINALKYLSTIIALAMRTAYDLRSEPYWKFLAITTSAVATIFSTYWDLVMDWGLLRPKSRNPWLRDKLLVPRKSVYFVAMVLNVILRLAWLQSVLGFRETPFLHRKALSAIVACLEIIRRGIWNFFRLENEHLNNVGKYRAFKTVPLPFNYDYDDERKEE